MIQTDVLVIGSGIGGLMLALEAAEFADVVVLSKRSADDTNTNRAQGGIAAVFDPRDSFAAHVRDTLRCGAGLCDPEVVRQVVREGPERVRELEALGVPFTQKGGRFALGREGGHSARRIVHARDFTGQAIETSLLERVRRHPRIRLLENQLAVDLILHSRLPRSARANGGARAARRLDGAGSGHEICWGAYVMDRGTRRIQPFSGRVTVLATGGCGKVYLYTSNPDVATGDGIAMAYRAGAPVANLEFVQFHPTCLYHPGAKSFLLSEALRGEGAVLRTLDGTRFMPGVHKDAELAPRDVVARAIDRELKRRGEPHVYLDITHRPAALVRNRFPNIHQALRRYGFDLAREPIPVVPAAHYMCGGVRAGLSGRTSIDGLLAIGEVACTGLHGANRLASNSLLEALVGAHHAATEVRRRLALVPRAPRPEAWSAQGTRPALETVVFDHNWDAVRRVMWDLVGIVRSDQRLAFAARHLALLREVIEQDYVQLRLSPDLIELRNIALIGSLIVAGAARRRESRGLHFNLDHPAAERGLGRAADRAPPPRRRASAARHTPASCRPVGGRPIVGGSRASAREGPAETWPDRQEPMNPFETSLWDAIDQIREADARYAREAYAFVVGALGMTVQSLPPERLEDPERRHLSGQELLQGVVGVARREFGPLAGTVFQEWGLHSGEDIGRIVFDLVESGQLSARPQDTIEDFRGGPPLREALRSELEFRPLPHRPREAGAGGSPEAGT